MTDLIPPSDPRPEPPAQYVKFQRVEAPIAHLTGLSCRHFARLTATKFDRPLTRTEELRYRFNRSFCGICARFAQQFSVLHELAQEVETETTPAELPDPAAIERVNAAVRAKLKS